MSLSRQSTELTQQKQRNQLTLNVNPKHKFKKPVLLPLKHLPKKGSGPVLTTMETRAHMG